MVPAAVGAAAALLALSTLGLTWVSRTVEGPLGDAGAAQVEQLSGRDVAPLVAALVPGVTAVVVVALLLRGWWRVGALAVAAVGAGAATLSAGAFALGGQPDASTTTAVPLVATLACLLVTGCAVTAAVGAGRATHGTAFRPADPAPVSRAPASQGPASQAPASQAPASQAPEDQVPTDQASPPPAGPPPVLGPEPTPADLWRELDEGRDPTGTA
ncbi:Trp biosynthesis-associated membrane protein [Aquipuribacter sp. MA13-13]|uniref:Trp biosynthesis-associated membrane protein n=1 Tax=Aquipuribacter sp. MA13-13 TaxID=3440840 RepID=UPI003EE99C0E